jgi:hypothetical protein
MGVSTRMMFGLFRRGSLCSSEVTQVGASPPADMRQPTGRRAITSASSASTGWPGASVTDLGTVSFRTRISSAGWMSAAMSLGRYNTSGSCGPPCPEVRFSRSCPTTRSVPSGATASAATSRALPGGRSWVSCSTCDAGRCPKALSLLLARPE